MLNKPHGASIPRSTISSPSALNQEKNRLPIASPPILAVPAFRVAKAADFSCVFRPLAQEHLAFGAETVKIQRQRQRLGLTLAFAAFRTPAPAKNTPPVRWPIESYAQAAVLIRGRIDFQIPDRASVIVQAGQWFIASPGHAKIDCRIAGDVELLWFECSEEIWREFSACSEPDCSAVKNCFACQYRPEHLVVAGGPYPLVTELATVLSQNQGATIGDRLRMEARSLELLALLLEQPLLPATPPPPPCDQHADKDALIEAARFLEDNLGDDHSLRAISRTVHLNEFKLKKGFRQRFGKTVFGYLRQKRMEHARHLLIRGDATVLAIANQVGYSNPSHFARAFRDAFGLNPREVSRRP